jgi:hypothetical protein
MEYLAVIGITGWLPLAYYNVYKQDKYLTPFTTKSTTRNMYISRALRAVRCPLLGPLLGRGQLDCAKQKIGPTTWMTVFLFLLVGTVGSIHVFKKLDASGFLFPSVVSIMISVMLLGLLAVPYGSGPDQSKKYHLIIAITAFALMIINSFYLSAHVGSDRKTFVYTLTFGLCVTAMMAGSSEAIVDDNIPSVTHSANTWYKNKPWHQWLIDGIFQLGENLPVIMYGAIILAASSSKTTLQRS